MLSGRIGDLAFGMLRPICAFLVASFVMAGDAAVPQDAPVQFHIDDVRAFSASIMASPYGRLAQRPWGAALVGKVMDSMTRAEHDLPGHQVLAGTTGFHAGVDRRGQGAPTLVLELETDSSGTSALERLMPMLGRDVGRGRWVMPGRAVEHRESRWVVAVGPLAAGYPLEHTDPGGRSSAIQAHLGEQFGPGRPGDLVLRVGMGSSTMAALDARIRYEATGVHEQWIVAHAGLGSAPTFSGADLGRMLPPGTIAGLMVARPGQWLIDRLLPAVQDQQVLTMVDQGLAGLGGLQGVAAGCTGPMTVVLAHGAPFNRVGIRLPCTEEFGRKLLQMIAGVPGWTEGPDKTLRGVVGVFAAEAGWRDGVLLLGTGHDAIGWVAGWGQGGVLQEPLLADGLRALDGDGYLVAGVTQSAIQAGMLTSMFLDRIAQASGVRGLEMMPDDVCSLGTTGWLRIRVVGDAMVGEGTGLLGGPVGLYMNGQLMMAYMAYRDGIIDTANSKRAEERERQRQAAILRRQEGGSATRSGR